MHENLNLSIQTQSKLVNKVCDSYTQLDLQFN